jgi:hypothetical protein
LLASTTTSEHRSIEPAVMASEIERLPDLKGFLKFASIPDWMRVTLEHVSYPIVVRTRRPDTPPNTPEAEPETAPTPPAAILPDTAALPATPARSVKSRAPTRKRTRKSRPEDAQSIGEPRETAGVRDGSNGADSKQAETPADSGMH